jgi:hypothetical protein
MQVKVMLEEAEQEAELSTTVAGSVTTKLPPLVVLGSLLIGLVMTIV